MNDEGWTDELLAQKLKDNPDLKVKAQGNYLQVLPVKKQPDSVITTNTEGKDFIPLDTLRGKSGASKVAGHSKILERDFQQQIIDLAHLYGWKVAHFRPAMKKDGTWVTPVGADGKGFFDLVLVKPKYPVLFIECKSARGKITREEEDWWRLLRSAKGIYSNVFRPKHWDELVKLLSA